MTITKSKQKTLKKSGEVYQDRHQYERPKMQNLFIPQEQFAVHQVLTEILQVQKEILAELKKWI